MEKYFKHINYTAEDIAAGKYEAWDLIRPMWLVYDIYNGKHTDFSRVSMLKFLNADVNCDMTVNVTDAAAVVNAIP